MPVSFPSKDINARSFYTKGVADRRDDRAVRTHHAIGLANSATAPADYTEAAQAFIDEEGLFHHQDITLPLRTLTVRKWGATTARVIGEYSRRWNYVSSNPAQTLISYDTVRIITPWYRRLHDENGNQTTGGAPVGNLPGLPSGPIEFMNGAFNNFDIGAVPRRWQWERKALMFHLPTVLEFNPINQVFNLVDTINATDVTFGGMTFLQYRVRFDGMSVRVVESSGGVLYLVGYQFTALPYGWYGQIALPPSSPNPWRTSQGLQYQTANFVNAFPVHA